MIKSIAKNTAFIILLCFSVNYCVSCSRVNEAVGLPNDHEIEQAIEKIIENETGVLIDLTP